MDWADKKSEELLPFGNMRGIASREDIAAALRAAELSTCRSIHDWVEKGTPFPAGPLYVVARAIETKLAEVNAQWVEALAALPAYRDKDGDMVHSACMSPDGLASIVATRERAAAERATDKTCQAYQVIGLLLMDGDWPTDAEARRALDYFAAEGTYDDDFLPWPRESKPKANRIAELENDVGRLTSAYNALVMTVMRGTHREARDLARARFVEMCPEERVHAEKVARERDALGDHAEAIRYMTSLFKTLAPQCEPLDTATGLATQLDNFIAGLRGELGRLRSTALERVPGGGYEATRWRCKLCDGDSGAEDDPDKVLHLDGCLLKDVPVSEPVAYCHPGDSPHRRWLLAFDDADRGICIFTDEEKAYAAFEDANISWNCHLFVSAQRKHFPRHQRGREITGIWVDEAEKIDAAMLPVRPISPEVVPGVGWVQPNHPEHPDHKACVAVGEPMMGLEEFMAHCEALPKCGRCKGSGIDPDCPVPASGAEIIICTACSGSGDPMEGGPCPEGCGGKLHYPPVENCSCHVNPPCSACTDRKLICDACGWEEPEEYWPDTTTPKSEPNPWWVQHQEAKRRGHTFAHGGRVFDVSHDGSSGSTHVIEGRYEGPVTADDIIGYFGEGTFGHRGPTLYADGTFTYTKITD